MHGFGVYISKTVEIEYDLCMVLEVLSKMSKSAFGGFGHFGEFTAQNEPTRDSFVRNGQMAQRAILGHSCRFGLFTAAREPTVAQNGRECQGWP